jgi:hypothetical protein
VFFIVGVAFAYLLARRYQRGRILAGGFDLGILDVLDGHAVSARRTN